MALDDILRTIRADTDARVDEIEAASTAEISEIISRAESEARQAERAAAESLDRGAEREAARIVDRARLEARRVTLLAIETAYQEAIGELSERLRTIRETQAYRCVLARLLDEGLDVIGDASRLSVDPADATLARELVAERGLVGLAIEPTLSCSGGLDVATDDGRVVRNTFESRLARADDRLRGLVAGHLPDGAAT